MNNKFSLLKILNENISSFKQKVKTNIDYQEYTVLVENKEKTVFIPRHECNNFEQELSDIDDLDYDLLRNILRKYRGLLNEV